jgi:NADPH:quinone reductase-like Zn-dependent oxidoreductase/acyl carrier protein
MLPDDAPNAGRDTWLPVGVSRVRLNGSPAQGTWGHAVIHAERSEPGLLSGDVFLVDEEGRRVLEVSGMSLRRLDGAPAAERELDLYTVSWRPRPVDDGTKRYSSTNGNTTWLLLSSGASGDDPLSDALAARFESRGERHVRAILDGGSGYAALEGGRLRVDPADPESFRRLLNDAFGGDGSRITGIVHLGALGATPPQSTRLETLADDLAPVCGSALHLMQALEGLGGAQRPRLYLVTRGVQNPDDGRETVSLAQSTLWGLGRVIANEHPEMHCRLIDLAPASRPDDAELLDLELRVDDGEEQVVLREQGRFVARLGATTVAAPEEVAPEQTKRTVADDHPYRLDSTSPGILDNLALREFSRGAPAAGEVEIRVEAAGLNFSDVMKAMGIYPNVGDGPLPLGIECAGRVTAVGEGVTNVRPGDEVMAIGYFCFGSYMTTSAELVLAKPAGTSFADAASVPIAFLTSYYALHYLGRIRSGERVLIHSATGGVGLAAVQIARLAGAEIYATAGTEEKRAFLRELGIEHVMDSRSLAFADQMMEVTEGQGVDLVLNSLAGEAIPRGMSILRPHGRFLELGKRDIYDNSPMGLAAFKNNVSFFAIDLDQTVRERPALVGSLLREMMKPFEGGDYRPLPVTTYRLSAAADAFRFMAQAKHLGKVVLTADTSNVEVLPETTQGSQFRADATYLITGGLGGIGLATAQWMSARGARNFALMGRSGASAAAEPVLDALRRAGSRVEVLRADVSDAAQVERVLAEIARAMPPLRGVIHAAGILDDGVLGQQNLDRFRGVMKPKVDGAWNLHRLTADTPLDFFVLFSSAATVFGSAGQSNYSAANAFLDALAAHRRALGRPAVAINWGAWGEVGLASRPDRIEWLKRQGVLPFSNKQGLQALGRLIQGAPTAVMANSVDWSRYVAFLPKDREFKLLEELVGDGPAEAPATATTAQAAAAPASGPAPATPTRAAAPAGGSIREELLSAPEDQRKELLESYLQEAIAKVLGLTAAKLNRQRSLLTLGLDSLMATEIRNRIEASLGVVLPVTTLLQGCSVAELTNELLDQLPTSAPSREERMAKVLEQVDKLSPEEARALLAKKKSEQAQRRNLR